MAIRFLIIWALVTFAIWFYRTKMKKKDKKASWTLVKQLSVSGVISVILIAIIMLGNNIEGV